MSGTLSGIPIRIGNIGNEEACTVATIARMLGLSVHELQMDVANGELPPLPPSTRMFGMAVFDHGVARMWTEDEVPAWRARRKAAATRAAQERDEAAQRERAREAQESAWASEQIALRAQLQAERDAVAAGEAPKDHGGVTPFAGGAL
jgi:hypothetical protein